MSENYDVQEVGVKFYVDHINSLTDGILHILCCTGFLQLLFSVPAKYNPNVRFFEETDVRNFDYLYSVAKLWAINNIRFA
jgi:hypothetical protein